jgi:hypothetical protein
MAQAVQLARLWTTLSDVQESLDNIAIPLGHHLSLEDPELMTAMEELSAKIRNHFEKFRLVAEPRRQSSLEKD